MPRVIGNSTQVITQGLVREFFSYNSRTGVLCWKKRDRKWFVDSRSWNTWNARYAGCECVTTKVSGRQRYHQVVIFGRIYLVHRVIFLWMKGRWPEPVVDHFNQNGCDNRWCNLRETDCSINGKNSFRNSNNTSGVTGVHKMKNGKFLAHIVGRNIAVFITFKEAAAARKLAEKRLGFSPNHGRARPQLGALR